MSSFATYFLLFFAAELTSSELPGLPFLPPMPQAPNKQCGPVNKCIDDSKYRTVDGSCNNIEISTWGQADTRYLRLAPARYADNAERLRLSVGGGPLPNSRGLKLRFFSGDEDHPAEKLSLAVMQWGQLIAHDTALSRGQSNAGSCCVKGRAVENSGCASIPLSRADPFYKQFNRSCMSITRTGNTKSNGCRLFPVTQINAVTHFLDLSLTYGSSVNVAKRVRAFNNGLLKAQIINGKEFCPSTPSNNCDPRSKACYFAGDVRVNQNPGISALQVLMLREHNRVARELSKLNPKWNDEILYHEARRIVIAEAQQITYYGFLPYVIGTSLDSFGEKYKTYDKNVDPSTINSFTTGCYRYLHSLVQGTLQLFDEDGNVKIQALLREFFLRPDITQNNFDQMLLGLAKQPAQKPDEFFAIDIGQFLFKGNRPFGDDLDAIDIMRGRDHGLPSYNDLRSFCGAPRAKSFKDLQDLIKEEDVDQLSEAYKNVDDVDFFVAAVMENKLPNSLYGPTCQCIVAEQFRRWRVGDRYFFEHPNQPGSFSAEMLAELKKASLARLMCDNGNEITKIQPDAFLQVSDKNKVQPCSSLPAVSLQPWKE